MENIEIAAMTQLRAGGSGAGLPSVAQRLPALLWRDPHSVPPEKLAEVIASLERACLQSPGNVDLRTCLGMAYAMNYDPYRSMDALEEARRLAPENFLAQFKYAELFFRLRVVERAEAETARALELAGNGWELSLAREQLGELRELKRKGLVRGGWMGSLKAPAIGFAILLVIFSVAYLVWK
jgi:hypothetical protein